MRLHDLVTSWLALALGLLSIPGAVASAQEVQRDVAERVALLGAEQTV